MAEPEPNYEELLYRVLEAERGLLRRVLGPEVCERMKGSPLQALESYIQELQQKEAELQLLQDQQRKCDD